jgi:N-acyl-D-aspartate/D-glutamate deacylase
LPRQARDKQSETLKTAAPIWGFLFLRRARDRERTRGKGAGLPLEFLVQKQTRKTAEAFGLLDRGLLAVGAHATKPKSKPKSKRNETACFEEPFSYMK